jgi:hypothetical protein
MCVVYIVFAFYYAFEDKRDLDTLDKLAIAFRFVAAFFYGIDGVLLLKTIGCNDVSGRLVRAAKLLFIHWRFPLAAFF